ncbi:2939_t:CDS:2, partial [Paraglomus brasilianum]
TGADATKSARATEFTRANNNKNTHPTLPQLFEHPILCYLVYVMLKLKGVYEEIPNNIIDETVDETIKNYNQKDNNSTLKFKSKKDLAHTIAKFFENWNHFYVSDLRPLHFEPQRKHNKWPFKKINCNCKVTYRRKTNDWTLSWVHERPKQNREAHEKFVAIDPGVRTPFVTYLLKVGKNDAQRLVRLGLHADRWLSSQRDILNNSTLKRKKRKVKKFRWRDRENLSKDQEST